MNPSIASYLSDTDTLKFPSQSEIELQGQRNALNIFQAAAVKIPAYKHFLKKQRINAENIKTIADFTKIPPTTKENYIFQYPLQDRCWNSSVTDTHAFATSSGSTGEPLFWPRFIEQEVDGARIHENILINIFEVNKKKTLFINSFGLGNWIAGMYTHACLYLNRLKGIPFTLATPGYSEEETFKVIKNYAHFFDQIIISCHPPILKIMLENGRQHGISWEKLNVRFLGAAEGFSENWRAYLAKLAHQTDLYRTIINIYGSADAGLMGYETPLSIAIHQLTATEHPLNQHLFHSERNPYLYQFDPRYRYLEESRGEIAITMNAVMPLIRYNIHDHGGTITYQSVIDSVQQKSPTYFKSFPKHHLHPNAWPLPFVYIFGRDRYMVSLYGVNIYPENVKAVLEHESMQPHFTGRFIVDKQHDKNHDQFLELIVELKPHAKSSSVIKTKLSALFVKILKDINSEYNQVEMKFTTKMHPHVKLSRYNHPQYFPTNKIKKSA